MRIEVMQMQLRRPVRKTDSVQRAVGLVHRSTHSSSSSNVAANSNHHNGSCYPSLSDNEPKTMDPIEKFSST